MNYSEEIVSNINDVFYENTAKGLLLDESSYTGEVVGDVFFPEYLKILLKRPIIIKSEFYTVFELLYKDKYLSPDFYKIVFGPEFYDCSSDNGAWVEKVFFDLEEERIGAELEKMEKIIQTELYAPSEEKNAQEMGDIGKAMVQAENENAQAPENNENTENGEKKPEEEIININEVRKSDETLGFMEFGKEIFIPQKNGDNWIFINAFEDKVTRSFYDNLFRCYCEEKWIIDGKGKEDIVRTIKTEFFNNTYKPSLKITITPVLENKKNKEEKYSEKKQFFNEKGFLIKEEVYNVIGEKKLIQSVLNLTYNQDDKVKESNGTEYFYEGENKDKLSYSFDKKYLYEYNSNDIPPNFDYYEDGQLKIRNIYQTADTYTSEVFFYDEYRVKTFYEDGKLKKEVSVTNGNERIKNYE